jgi:hypothetical protein
VHVDIDLSGFTTAKFNLGEKLAIKEGAAPPYPPSDQSILTTGGGLPCP